MKRHFALASFMILLASIAAADTYSCSFKPTSFNDITPKSMTVVLDRTNLRAAIEDAVIDGAETQMVFAKISRITDKNVTLIWESRGYILTTGKIYLNNTRAFPLVDYRMQIRTQTGGAMIRALALSIGSDRHDYSTSGRCVKVS